ncbi:lasso peptide biosynthesis B2 protein [Sphingobium sp. AN558]|uniref:lasso peptide biosynthesis B2 protein n=1 Tax=Sphingobium sp. AN558 TaxID=3133442 RepID=UPI0030C61D19
MAFQLRAGLVYTACQDDIILLDLKQDRYFALPRPLHSPFHALVEQGGEDALARERLSFILDPAGPEQADRPATPPRANFAPLGGQLAPAPGSPGLPTLASAFRYRAISALWLRVASLHHIIERIERTKRCLAGKGTRLDDAALIASAFDRVAPLFPIRDRCMSMAIGLIMAMLRREVPATLVIGVRTAPFSAHCWVEVDGLLVNGDLETVRPFTPILIV